MLSPACTHLQSTGGCIGNVIPVVSLSAVSNACHCSFGFKRPVLLQVLCLLAGQMSFPALTVLGIQSGTKMSGSLPPEWGSPRAFQRLQYLYVVDCTLTGMLFTLLIVQITLQLYLVCKSPCTCLVTRNHVLRVWSSAV